MNRLTKFLYGLTLSRPLASKAQNLRTIGQEMLVALEIIHCDHVEMLLGAARVCERSVQVNGTKRTAEIDRVVVELGISLRID